MIAAMLAGAGARLPGSRRQMGTSAALSEGVEISDALRAELQALAAGRA